MAGNRGNPRRSQEYEALWTPGPPPNRLNDSGEGFNFGPRHEDVIAVDADPLPERRTIPLKAPAKKTAASKGAAKSKSATKPAAKKAVKAAKPKSDKPAARKTAGEKPAPRKAATKAGKPSSTKPRSAPRKAPFRAAPAAEELPVKEPLPEIPAELLEAAPKAKKPRKPRGKKGENAKPLTSLSTILAQLEDAKAEQIVTITLDDKTALADTMVVASGRSNRHVGAIADQIVEKLKANGYRDLRIEGMPQCDWVLVDAGDVVVHIFRPEVRSFYNLEKLWSEHAPNERAIQ